MITLVSYPRCGSHYLRSLMEDYSGMRDYSWTSRGSGAFWCNHIHDRASARTPWSYTGKVIHLYRDPVDVVYSLAEYHQVDDGFIPFDQKWDHFADQYLAHCRKYFTKNIAEEKFTIRYEDLTSDDMAVRIQTFFGMLDFIDLGVEKDEEKMTQVFLSNTYDRVREKVDDKNIVRGNYGNDKTKFRDDFGREIYFRFKEFEEFIS